jgi:DNA topoisomerase-2
VRRAIPSIVDGLKPSQRKILYGAFKKQQWKEIRVDQFSGSVSEVSAYHHSDDSLALTIILMAQRFVGSNNLNLLQPIGQFGSRRNVSRCFTIHNFLFFF